MARDILSGFGPNISKKQAPTATCGGVTESVDVMNYRAPTGPTNIGDSKGPGLHGTNHGCGQQFSSASRGGGPGLGGSNNGLNPRK